MISEELGALWDDCDYAKTEAAFRELLSKQTDADDRAEVSTQIAHVQAYQEKFDEAHETLDTIEPEIADRSARVRVLYFLERGRVLDDSGNPDASRPIFIQAWKAARGAGYDSYAIDAANGLARVEPPEKQLRWCHRAIELAEESDEPRARKWLKWLYRGAGRRYSDTNHFKDALGMFEKALRGCKEEGNARMIRVAEGTLARCLRSLGRFEEALAIQLRLVDEWTGPRADVLEEVGECLLALGREDEARSYFEDAYAMLKDHASFVEQEAERFARIERLARGSE